MSMRHNVTKEDIEKFLDALGKSFHKPGRLYLAGGAALVHIGLRAGFTMDIDVAIETSDEDEMVTAIRRLVEKMQILFQKKLITLEELDAAYNEVLPRMGKRPYINLNPQRFAERYALIRQKLQE